MEKLKELLTNECLFRSSDKLLDELLAPAESIELKKSEVLIMSGWLGSNVYIIKNGAIRYSYMNEMQEVTSTLALPGNVTIIIHSYYTHLPAFYQTEAYYKSIVFEAPQSHYVHLVSSSHEFVQQTLRYAQGQLFYLEKKDSAINGNARERFISLIHKRPEIMEKVALKHVAFHLGIAQPYLSLLKKQLKSIQRKAKFYIISPYEMQ